MVQVQIVFLIQRILSLYYKNNLKGYDLDKVSRVLEKHGKDLNVRAEALDVEVFVEIANELS